MNSLLKCLVPTSGREINIIWLIITSRSVIRRTNSQRNIIWHEISFSWRRQCKEKTSKPVDWINGRAGLKIPLTNAIRISEGKRAEILRLNSLDEDTSYNKLTHNIVTVAIHIKYLQKILTFKFERSRPIIVVVSFMLSSFVYFQTTSGEKGKATSGEKGKVSRRKQQTPKNILIFLRFKTFNEHLSLKSWSLTEISNIFPNTQNPSLSIVMAI